MVITVFNNEINKLHDKNKKNTVSLAYIKKGCTPIQVYPVPNVYINSFVVCSCIILRQMHISLKFTKWGPKKYI